MAKSAVLTAAQIIASWSVTSVSGRYRKSAVNSTNAIPTETKTSSPHSSKGGARVLMVATFTRREATRPVHVRL